MTSPKMARTHGSATARGRTRRDIIIRRIGRNLTVTLSGIEKRVITGQPVGYKPEADGRTLVQMRHACRHEASVRWANFKKKIQTRRAAPVLEKSITLGVATAVPDGEARTFRAHRGTART